MPVVLTGPVGNTDITSGNGHTRRRVLGTAAGTALAAAGATALGGCGLLDEDPQPAPPPDPAQPVLDGAWELAAVYDRAITAQPALSGRLTPIAEAHRSHAAELARVIGGAAATTTTAAPTPSQTGPAGDPAATVRELRTAEQKAQRVAATACRSAAADRAALIGSIAAARAAHAEALRGAA